MKQVRVFKLALSVLLLACSTSQPNTPVRGRNADGTAFRVTSDGLELSDYIAELEVTNDDLRRQVSVLEDELDKLKLAANSPKALEKVSDKDLIQQQLPRKAPASGQHGGVTNASPRAALSHSQSSGLLQDLDSSSTRQELAAALANIQKLVGERKTSYDRLSGKVSHLQLSPLKTVAGKTLDELRLEAQQVTDITDTAPIREGLGEIVKLLNADIELFRNR